MTRVWVIYLYMSNVGGQIFAEVSTEWKGSVYCVGLEDVGLVAW